MDRWVAYWKREMPGQILATVGARNPHPRPSRWDRYVRERHLQTDRVIDRPPVFENLEQFFEMYEAQLPDPDEKPPRLVNNDSVHIAPTFMPTVHFGEGVNGAFFGGKLRFASTDVKTESVCEPVITDWSQLDSLRFDESNAWVQKVLEVLRYFAARSCGRFSLAPYATIDGLNFAVVMRGATQAFMEVYDRREELRRLFELGLVTTIRYWDLQKAIIQENNEAVIQHKEYARWGQFHAMPALSVDAYGLCRAEVYQDIGLEFTQRLIDYYGGGYLHLHSLGHHLAPVVGKLRSLTQLDCIEDPRCDRAFHKIQYFRESTGDTPLTVRCTLEELKRGLRAGSLPGGVCYWPADECDSVEEANRLMDQVRAYRVSG